jgi:hypothetical protein
MNKIFFSFLIISLITTALDTPNKYCWLVPAKTDYTMNQNKIRNCFICKKPGVDTCFIDRFKPSIHKKCYDPILEIEPIYAESIITELCRRNCYYQADFSEYVLKRKELIKKVYQHIQSQNYDSFNEFTDDMGKDALKIVFWTTYVLLIKELPILNYQNQENWNIPLEHARFIPEGNENILAVNKWTYPWTRLKSFLMG